MWDARYALGRFLNSIGAVRRGGEVLAPCPLFDERHIGSDPLKIVISRGSSYPLIFWCRSCKRDGQNDISSAWSLPTRDVMAEWVAEADRNRYYPLEVAEEAPVVYPPAGTLDAAYSRLLAEYPVAANDAALQWLAERGISPELAEELQYGWFPAADEDSDWREAAIEMVDLHLAELECDYGSDSIPGLYAVKDIPCPGIAVPCRHERGLIHGIKVRFIDRTQVRMQSLSSKTSGGLRSVKSLHFAAKISPGCELFLVEGERKADVVQHCWTAKPPNAVVVGVPGVGFARFTVDWLAKTYEQYRFSRIAIGMDHDSEGRKTQRELVKAVTQLCSGFAEPPLIEELDWPGRKIDDAVQSGKEVTAKPIAQPHFYTNQQASTLIAARFEDVLSKRCYRLEDFNKVYPQLSHRVAAAIRDGRVEQRRYLGVGPLIGLHSSEDSLWEQEAKRHCKVAVKCR